MSAPAFHIREPVLVLAPVDGDARAIEHVLSLGGFRVRTCADLQQFVASLKTDVGAVIVAEEALLRPGEAEVLAKTLADQPDWSDLPVILLARQGTNEDTAWALARGFENVGNITILERPLRQSTLLNAVGVALRARARQYDLRAHREHLEGTIQQRTAELAASMQQFQARERLAALGTLAAGLGHDIANLVLPIRMRLEPLTTECPTSQGREDLAAIGTALNYLTNLSAGLRLMALDPSRETASENIENLAWWWDQVEGVMRGVLPRHVRLESNWPKGLGARVAAHRLTQAVFNLVQNAGEALAGKPGGTVRVTAAHHQSPTSWDMVQLRVSDDGPGMSPEVIRRCFEPYFSTKGRAIATGMGLGMVRGVVESAGGSVDVQSQPGHGTVFTLTLRAIMPPPTIAAPATAARSNTASLSIKEPRAAAVAAMLLEGLELKTIRTSSAAPPDGLLWVVQDPTRGSVEEFLSRCPASRVVILQSDAMEVADASFPDDQAGRDKITILPLSVPPSALREALVAAVRGKTPGQPVPSS